MDAKSLAVRIAAVAAEKKGEKITVLDMRPVAGFCDYFVIASANSLRQVNAISEAIHDNLAHERIKPLSQFSPHDESGWVVLDYSSVVVHIFAKPMREFYSLEHLWSDAKRVRLSKKAIALTFP